MGLLCTEISVHQAEIIFWGTRNCFRQCLILWQKNEKQSEEEEEPETVRDNCCVSPTGLLICLN